MNAPTATRTVRPATLTALLCDRGAETLNVTVRLSPSRKVRVNLLRADRLVPGDVVLVPTLTDPSGYVAEVVTSLDRYGDDVEYNRVTTSAGNLVALVTGRV